MTKIRVAISYLYFPLAMGKYFEAALRRREDVEVVSVGPYTGTYIPWNGGMSMPAKYSKSPDIPLPKEFAGGFKPRYMTVASQMPWKPDLWIQVDAGFHFLDKPDANIVVHVGTDPHVLLQHYQHAKAYSDICFGMQGPYMQPKDVFLPYAADPIWHAPMEMRKEFDCCLIGLHYEHRDRLVAHLRSKGISVYYGLGEIFDENRLAYNRARIALSWSSLQDTPARVYEAFSMALPLVSNRTPDLMGMFVEGDHFLGFNDVNEAEQQVRKLLQDESMREEMRLSAYRKVHAQHLWDHRIEQILDKCGLLPSANAKEISIRLNA